LKLLLLKVKQPNLSPTHSPQSGKFLHATTESYEYLIRSRKLLLLVTNNFPDGSLNNLRLHFFKSTFYAMRDEEQYQNEKYAVFKIWTYKKMRIVITSR